MNSAENSPSDAALIEAVKPWLSRPNIVGLDVGPKAVDGQVTDVRSIVVHVVRKTPVAELGAEDFPIPEQFAAHTLGEDGTVREVTVPTDVVEVGDVRLDINNERIRPAEGGYQIRAENMPGTGTLGVNIVWASKYRLMTNNHVIACNGNAGADVYQPSNGVNNKIGTVNGFIPVVTYPSATQPHPHFNTQDLAWTYLTPATGSPEITQIGVPRGVRAPVLGESIVLVGKQTGSVQKASIASVAYTTKVEWPAAGSWAWFDTMIRLDANVTQPGDSGSAYVALSDGMVVGIHVAGNASFSWGCQLSPF
ncbi:S1 family peptidase [Arthrobacter sp. CJ23]|uniref:S1 family peptidase n=1 Tax=Arthrobacter sp. CJ23 TaxID=2972479 RepID=UPI00215C7DC3|nr:S1 family peptidase [Arthrobacter sp. CJ23]UVJ39059.1 S1 family peptidase [Arthrobacter sp. CJ23]